VAIALGCLELMRGFMHTILLERAASDIAGFDLSTALTGDLPQMMGGFDISNIIAGVMLVLVGFAARPLALAILGVIPVAYGVGIVGIRLNSTHYAPSQADWDGSKMMMACVAVCVITFLTGIITSQLGKKRSADAGNDG
jgi:hypothetical protein